MNRRQLLQAGALVLGPTLPRLLGPAARRWDGYERAIVIDGLGGVGDRRGAAEPDLSAAALDHIRSSGVSAVNATVGPVGSGADPFRSTIADIGRWQVRLDRYPSDLVLIRRTRDVPQAKRDRRLGIVFGFQDTAMLEGQLETLSTFHDLGVRIIQLTYNRRNAVGDGALEPGNRGLTSFGRGVVEEMNRLRMLIDLSHCGPQTTHDGIRYSTQPVSITHSGCRALADLPRNKTDADLRALADRGGVFGVYFMPFLRERGQPDARDVVRHLEHALNVCGEDHVGIGTDGSVSPVALTPEYRAAIRREIAERRAAGISAPGETDDIVPLIPDLNHPRRLERIADRLAARGHSATRIEKVLGDNFLRVFGEVWGD